MPGLWEFPGGKCEPGETPRDAAIRECHEETGLVVVSTGLRQTIRHHYPHGRVQLSYFNVIAEDSDASPEASSGFVWVHAETLPNLEFPEANAPLLDALAREYGVDG